MDPRIRIRNKMSRNHNTGSGRQEFPKSGTGTGITRYVAVGIVCNFNFLHYLAEYNTHSISVVDPDPHWFWLAGLDPDLGGQKSTHKNRKSEKFHDLKYWTFNNFWSSSIWVRKWIRIRIRIGLNTWIRIRIERGSTTLSTSCDAKRSISNVLKCSRGNFLWKTNCFLPYLKILSLPGLAWMPAFVTPIGQGALPIAISMYRSFAADKQK